IWISTSATTSHLYISTAGKVGIGTNSPSAKLTINTSIGNALLAMNDVGGTPAIYAYNSSIGAYGIRADAVGTGTKYGIYGRATGGGTNQAGLFTASGGTNNWGVYVTAGQSYFDDEVGIGIDAPTHKLHVVGGILATSSITASSFHGDGSNLDGLDFSIGDSYGGGKIFWLDASREHGLISTTEEQSAGLIWGPNSVTAATLSAVYAGKANTSKIVAAYGAGTSAAKLCADYTVTVNDEYYDDWYLPSIYEWSLLNPHYEVVGGFTSGHYYWTSNEKDTNVSYLARVGAGNQIETNKSNPYHVRCIRSDSSIGTSGDNLGHHMASQNIKLNGNWLSNDGGDEGVFVDSAGKVGIGTASPAGGLH
ncbi:MAG: hypothetical protein KAS59_04005, partial [Alphaproteobacteria bacterium]|nr:hypothetical protein [Alphaproteobacteria bacterium]